MDDQLGLTPMEGKFERPGCINRPPKSTVFHVVSCVSGAYAGHKRECSGPDIRTWIEQASGIVSRMVILAVRAVAAADCMAVCSAMATSLVRHSSTLHISRQLPKEGFLR